MTVSELIEKLSKYPGECRVVVPGYEDGYDDVELLRSVNLKGFEPAAWYYGRYDKADDGGEPAVLLVRKPSVDERIV